jgi:hypothetical protein
MELGSYHSIYEIITAPGITITGLYRQLQDSSFFQRSVTSTRLHHVTAQKTSFHLYGHVGGTCYKTLKKEEEACPSEEPATKP